MNPLLYAETRAALRYTRTITERALPTEGYYGCDRLYAQIYLQDFPKWKRKVFGYLRDLAGQGESVVYADVCGRATGVDLGASRNYSFSLQPTDYHFSPCKGETRMQGDIFSMKDFYSFVGLLRRNGDYPAFVTFEPVAGLQNYSPCGKEQDPFLRFEVSYQRLENNLCQMIGVLKEGGFLFLGPPFQFMNSVDFWRGLPQEEYPFSRWVKALCKELRCSVEIGPSYFAGPRFLIRKHIVSRKRKS